MEHFFNFVVEHWFLWTLFIVILAAIVWLELQSGAGGTRVSPPQAVDLMNYKKAVVLDARSQEDFNHGHIIDALHWPLQDLKPEHKKLQKYKSKPIIIVCAQEQKALKAVMSLKQAGYEQVCTLQGGMEAWRQANMPVVKSKQK
jgi:rhodanese-related sulfurtransferase